MQALIQERLAAMQIAKSRDLAFYLMGFTGLLAIPCVAK